MFLHLKLAPVLWLALQSLTWGGYDGPRKIEHSMQQNAGFQNADETV
jgi:hypothetical protein